MKTFTKILALLLTLQSVYSQHLEDYDEHGTIQEYLRYVDSTTGNLYNDALAITKKTCQEMLDNIPVEESDEITAALRKFIDDATRAEYSTDNDDKKAVLDSLNHVLLNSLQLGSQATQEIIAEKLTSASNYLEFGLSYVLILSVHVLIFTNFL